MPHCSRAAPLRCWRTPLGPLTIRLGVATASDWRIVLALGRPVEERSVSDPFC